MKRIIGSALDLHYTPNAAGDGILMRPPKLPLNSNFPGKPEDIYLLLGRHPRRLSATRPAISKCWSTPRQAAVRLL